MGNHDLRQADERVRALRIGKVCDGLLLYGTQVIVLESKASLLTAEARSGKDRRKYRERIQDILLDGLDQVIDTISAIESGQWAIPGLAHQSVTFFPVIVTLEAPITNSFWYQELERLVRDSGRTLSSQTRPWQLLHIEELEVACSGVDKGKSFADLLDAKTRDPRTVGESFVNFCHLRNEPFLSAGPHPELAHTFDRLTRNVIKMVRAS